MYLSSAPFLSPDVTHTHTHNSFSSQTLLSLSLPALSLSIYSTLSLLFSCAFPLYPSLLSPPLSPSLTLFCSTLNFLNLLSSPLPLLASSASSSSPLLPHPLLHSTLTFLNLLSSPLPLLSSPSSSSSPLLPLFFSLSSPPSLLPLLLPPPFYLYFSHLSLFHLSF